MGEVEGEDRGVLGLGDRHDRGVDEPESERSVTTIDLDRAPEHRGRQRHAPVDAVGKLLKEGSRGLSVGTTSQEPVGLDRDWFRDQELAADAGDQRRGEVVSVVPSRQRRDERARIDDYRGRSSSEASASAT